MTDGKEWKASNARKSDSPKTPKMRKGTSTSGSVGKVKVDREE